MSRTWSTKLTKEENDYVQATCSHLLVSPKEFVKMAILTMAEFVEKETVAKLQQGIDDEANQAPAEATEEDPETQEHDSDGDGAID